MKKALLIVVIIIILALFGWFFFFHKSVQVTTVSTTTNTSPFGTAPSNITGSTTPTSSNGGVLTGSSTPGITPTLFQVSADPVAGGVIYINKSKQELIRYVDRASGHIYEVNPVNLVKTEIVDTTIPKIYNTLWKPDGTGVILQSLQSDEDMVVNTSITLVPPQSTSTDALYTTSTTNLRGNISSPALKGSTLAYVLNDSGSVATSGFAGQKPATLYTSPFTEWQLAWSGNSLTLTTNASSAADGYAYLLNTSSGSLTKLLGPMTALTTLPNSDGSRVLYSDIENGNTALNSLNTKTKAITPILPTTLPEKCVWSTKQVNVAYCGTPVGGVGGDEPDSWYQGSVHFSDQLWKFDADNDIATLLAEPQKTFNVALDVINPSLSPNEDYLLFMNKTDLSLWVLKLN